MLYVTVAIFDGDMEFLYNVRFWAVWTKHFERIVENKMNHIEKLYQQLIRIDVSEFWRIEADFVQILYAMPNKIKPTFAIAFITIANWFAMSERQGVWTFYECGNPKDLQITLQFLKQSGEHDLAEIFAYGLHDYQNPKYGYKANQILYPDEWIQESFKIDKWISEHEEWLYKWERDLLLINKDLICSL